MTSRKSVHNTHNAAALRALHHALLDIVNAMNRPERDAALVRHAGIDLDRALFPLLVGIGRFGPVGVVDLAARAGRDYTTVSRQVAKLNALGLVRREADPTDARSRVATLAAKGKAMLDRIDAARERLLRIAFAEWPDGEVDALVRLLRKFADAFGQEIPDTAQTAPRPGPR
jgi:DNA-binding MarR family transcriptional regulator